MEKIKKQGHCNVCTDPDDEFIIVEIGGVDINICFLCISEMYNVMND